MRPRTVAALIGALVLGTGPVRFASGLDLRGFMGDYAWNGHFGHFGGYSSIKVTPNGLDFYALSDHGTIVTGHIERDADGRIARVTAALPPALAIPPGPRPVDFRYDTEGLAVAPDGTFYVSCELVTRVVHYAAPDAPAEELPRPREFAAMALNGGLETIAVDAAGTIYTIPEETTRADGSYPVFRFRDGQWDVPFRIAGTPGFLPVDADFGPDGRFYLLERQFRGLGGFASRVRRMTITDGGATGDEVLLQTPPGTFGNLEGLGVWRDPQGALRLTMVSDDNFIAILGTEIVEVRVPD